MSNICCKIESGWFAIDYFVFIHINMRNKIAVKSGPKFVLT